MLSLEEPKLKDLIANCEKLTQQGEPESNK
jgi:hypothetical protein